MNNNYRVKLIAVCGGIASGKSMVIDALKSCGAKVLSCDNINRQMLQEPDYIELISANFEGVVVDGEVDKLALRSLILSNENQKKLLNSLAHPRIFERVISQAKEIGGVVFVEVPLFTSIVDNKIFDKIWFVKASPDLRLKRLMARDNIPQGMAEKFIAMQAQENIIEEFADCIIVNNDTYNQLCEKVKELYKQELLQ